MKKLILTIALTSALFSCKKETTNTNTSNTNNPSNSLVCVDNPNINFSSIGTPIGKFSDCIKDVDGNVYKTVSIGTQTWMAENLKTSKYSDGTPIPNVKDSLVWSKLTTGAWCYYNNDEKNNAKYGKLYNWYSVSKTSNGNKNVCPAGWHVPSDNELTVLIDYLGGESIAGGKMKEIGKSSWIESNNTANNLSLFSFIPSGGRESNGEFNHLFYYGGFYMSTESDGEGLHSVFSYMEVWIGKDEDPKEGGLSIRCLKD